MIAFGDLALEIGRSRLDEIQEEIRWLAEATQVFEQSTKENPPSRAEMTDADMSERAECMMLNKGASALDVIARRVRDHQHEKSARLRAPHRKGSTMSNAVKNIAKFILKHPENKAASDLHDLCMALESSGPFDLNCIYGLERKPFELAIQLIEEWRFDRHVSERRLHKYLAQLNELGED